MVDPAVGYSPDTNYPTVDRGLTQDIFMKNPNGSVHLGVVWPGVAVFPGKDFTPPDFVSLGMLMVHYSDWFHPSVQAYWDNEFKEFFNHETGIDIDGVWIVRFSFLFLSPRSKVTHTRNRVRIGYERTC